MAEEWLTTAEALELNHYHRMNSSDKEKIIYPNSYHELFNDLYRHKVYLDIQNWSMKRVKKKGFFYRLKTLYGLKKA